MRRVLLPVALAACALTTGCIGTVRETTTPRTATEMLLVSTAAERAVKKYDAPGLPEKQVFIDDSRFESVDKPYVMSALRDHLAGLGVILVSEAKPKAADNPGGAELIVEVRNAALGIWDGDFVLGIPQLPVSAQGFPPVMLPPLYLFRRYSHQGYAKFQVWVYDPATRVYRSRSGDLWGTSYYNEWWVLGIGPFDGSNDIYPDVEFGNYLPGSAAAEEEARMDAERQREREAREKNGGQGEAPAEQPAKEPADGE